MADPLSLAASAVGLVQSIGLTQKYLTSVAKFNREAPEFLIDLSDDLEILMLVLQECVMAIENYSAPPESISTALRICLHRQVSLVELLKDLIPHIKDESQLDTSRLFLRHKLSTAKKERLIGQSRSFREAVLLLRDLTVDDNEKRMHAQTMDVSLMANDQILRLSSSVEPTLDLLRREFEDHDQDHGDGSSHHSNEDLDHHEHDRSATQGDQQRTNGRYEPEQPRRLGRNRMFREFMQIARFNFTRDLILVLEVAGWEGQEKWEFVPVRNLVDTGSSENFVNRSVLINNGMDMSKVESIPIEHRTPRTLKTLGDKSFTPEEEVTLLWHRLNDRKQRKSTFIVVENAEFDTLIGARQFMSEEKVALPVVSVRKSIWPWRRGKEKKNVEDEAAETAARQDIREQYDALKRQATGLEKNK